MVLKLKYQVFVNKKKNAVHIHYGCNLSNVKPYYTQILLNEIPRHRLGRVHKRRQSGLFFFLLHLASEKEIDWLID